MVKTLLHTKSLQPEWSLNEFTNVRKIGKLLLMPGLCLPTAYESYFFEGQRSDLLNSLFLPLVDILNSSR